MPVIEKISDCRISASEDKPVRVHPILLRRLQKCGFDKCQGDGDTLSQQQLDAVLADQSVASRIELKAMVGMAGIWPKGAT